MTIKEVASYLLVHLHVQSIGHFIIHDVVPLHFRLLLC